MMNTRVSFLAAILILVANPPAVAPAEEHASAVSPPDLPDRDLVTAYERAAVQNVLAAVNPNVFFGYWSVCADGRGFGYGYTYPSLDGHQMTDALLWLDQVDVAKANWDYVRSFQRADGALPIAILPGLAGKRVGPEGSTATVAANGGLYEHWVPGNPLAALAGPTYIQNADCIFRFTQDRSWLVAQIGSINLAADYLASLTTADGAVRGAGYYVERPTRIESDGVSQCHAVDAFRRTAALNRVLAEEAAAHRYEALADRIEKHFTERFWVGTHFAEYLHPSRGLIATHGLTDVDWAALATGVLRPDQREILWPRLRREQGFYYGGMPTGISTRPESYEPWEFTHPDRHDLAAMGRVWYLEAWARARCGDAEGLLDGLHRVAAEGKKSGYFWRERYHPSKDGPAPAGAEKYCEYPANLIRIVQRFLLGVELRLDGTIVLAPTVPYKYWDHGFGQTLRSCGRRLDYRMDRKGICGTYHGTAPQRLGVWLPPDTAIGEVHAVVDGEPAGVQAEAGLIFLTLPAIKGVEPVRFQLIETTTRRRKT